ncbi:MAG: 4-hydroxythreonine-4-phosphate dehydrogenase PdxA [Desulfopila sp.]
MSPLAITMGCPVGIGPEIILRCFGASRTTGRPAVVIGDQAVLEWTADHLGLDISCVSWQPGDPLPAHGIPVCSVSRLTPGALQWGSPNRQTGVAMARYIEVAVELTRQGVLDGIVTCPISKTALRMADYRYPGHTEMLADLTGQSNYTMMMVGATLRVSLVTIHCSLQESIHRLNIASICHNIQLLHSALRQDFGISQPRIAVAGLNPHAGEECLFGTEERDIIAPAIGQFRQSMDIAGPVPPDTVFHKAAQGAYDGVVCMYHDQGLIPFKLLHFNDGVNVTIGLPIVRTSVDHGTAYDIAGLGLASMDSLAAAVELGAVIAANRKK